jgi:hypothetical protein
MGRARALKPARRWRTLDAPREKKLVAIFKIRPTRLDAIAVKLLQCAQC